MFHGVNLVIIGFMQMLHIHDGKTSVEWQCCDKNLCPQEKGSSEIVLKAMGRAINKTVMIAELIKRRIADLHQNTSIGSTDITDMWEPLEEGLLPLETTRHVSMITITLSKKELDLSSTGYQPPLSTDQVKPLNEFEEDGAPEAALGTRGRGRGARGRSIGRGIYGVVGGYNGDGWDSGRGVGGRARGRGRGNSFRGRGRGYGVGGYYDYGESDATLAQGRGQTCQSKQTRLEKQKTL
ncbi:hypothetical protein GOBAR_AA09560 [Gossypium barbadense]|uniref:DNA/RNA-binding protein Alba-like domain-containing protein n=1 Tax=Gossypium barbadense TaxID=3634 RepID=A0A2P5Y680_GOSBA|nr:hypothetical protein GOBAR_AA09560 [Gossypium barbadense]